MGQLHIRVIAIDNRSHANTESGAELNFSDERTQAIHQAPVISLLSLMFVLLFLLLPGVANAHSCSIPAIFQFQNNPVSNSSDASSNIPSNSPLSVHSIANEQYTGFTNTPTSDYSSNREES